MSRKHKKTVIAISGFILALIVSPTILSYLRWPSGEGEFEGTFTYEFEVQDFRPTLSLQNWWLDIDPNLLRPITESFWAHKDETVNNLMRCRLKVQGELSPKGHYGMARRKLTVHKVIDFEYIHENK